MQFAKKCVELNSVPLLEVWAVVGAGQSQGQGATVAA